LDETALDEILVELRELRALYKTLVDSLVPVEKPTPEEVEAIEGEDEDVDEEELKRILAQKHANRKRSEQGP
jgi:hypothetical protein